MIIIVSVFVQRDIFNLSSESGGSSRNLSINTLFSVWVYKEMYRVRSIEAKDNKDERGC